MAQLGVPLLAEVPENVRFAPPHCLPDTALPRDIRKQCSGAAGRSVFGGKQWHTPDPFSV
jgi:hypothetical protein